MDAGFFVQNMIAAAPLCDLHPTDMRGACQFYLRFFKKFKYS